MERIGAVQLGEYEVNKKFLTSILPNSWEEKVYNNNRFWACECKRKPNDVTADNYTEKQKEFDLICDKIREELGEWLMEIYSITSAGIHFVVYLKKKSLE